MGRKGRRKCRSKTPDKKGGGEANVAMEQNAEHEEWRGEAELEGAPTYEGSAWRAAQYEPEI
eukprot:14541035-Alexandrium_andersonii.AAC.1